MALKSPEKFGGSIESKGLTSSLSVEGSSLKVGCFSFISPVSASDFSNPIFDIKATEDKTNILTHILSRSSKNVIYFGSLAASASPKSSGGGFTTYSRTSELGGFNFGSSKGGS